jgi:hypothetical protein
VQKMRRWERDARRRCADGKGMRAEDAQMGKGCAQEEKPPAKSFNRTVRKV